MAEVISIGLNPISATQGKAYHAFIAYKNSAGTTYQLHGGGTVDAGGSAIDNAALNVSGFGSFGSLYSKVVKQEIQKYTEVVYQIHGVDLSNTFDKMVGISVAISASGTRYDMLGNNSN